MTYTDEQFAKLSGAYAVKVLESMDEQELYKFAYDMMLDSFVGDTAEDLRKEIAQIYDNDTLKELCEICDLPFVPVDEKDIEDMEDKMEASLEEEGEEVDAADVDIDVESEAISEKFSEEEVSEWRS